MEHFVDVPVKGKDTVTGAGGERLQSRSIVQRGERRGIIRQVRIIDQQIGHRNSSDAIGSKILQGQLGPVLGYNLPGSCVELDEIEKADGLHDAAAGLGIGDFSWAGAIQVSIDNGSSRPTWRTPMKARCSRWASRWKVRVAAFATRAERQRTRRHPHRLLP